MKKRETGCNIFFKVRIKVRIEVRIKVKVKISTKIIRISYIFFFKTIKLMFTGINIYPINNITYYL